MHNCNSTTAEILQIKKDIRWHQGCLCTTGKVYILTLQKEGVCKSNSNNFLFYKPFLLKQSQLLHGRNNNERLAMSDSGVFCLWGFFPLQTTCDHI